MTLKTGTGKVHLSHLFPFYTVRKQYHIEHLLQILRCVIFTESKMNEARLKMYVKYRYNPSYY